MNFKKLTMLCSMSAISLIGIGAANAACTYSGKVTSSYQNASTTWAYVVPANAIYSAYYYWFTTTDPDIAQSIHNAQGSGDYTTIYGNATSCPTTGTARYGGVLSAVQEY